MGTAILRSHDCLHGRFLPNDTLAIPSPHVRSRRNSNPNPNFNSYVNQNRRRKRSPVSTVQANHHDRDRRRSSDRSAVPAKSATAANLVMGQVKILKRGEKLSAEDNHGGFVVPAENVQVFDFHMERSKFGVGCIFQMRIALGGPACRKFGHLCPFRGLPECHLLTRGSLAL